MVALRLTALAALCTGCLAAPSPLCTGDYGAPQSLDTTGAVNSTMIEDSPWLSRDRLELVFARYDNKTGVAIFFSTRTSPTGAWSVANSALDGSVSDSNPYVSADGLTMWFTSGRSGGSLHIATRPTRGIPFTYLKPTALAAGAMSLTDDQLDIYYEPSPPSNTLYTQHRDSTAVDFTGTRTAIAVTDTQNGARYAPAISADGTVMLYTSDMPFQIFRATGRGAMFGGAQPFLTANNYDASLVDDSIIVYASQVTGQADLYFVERACN